MPVPLTARNSTGASYNGSDTSDWQAILKTDDGSTTFGTYANDTQTFTKGTSLAVAANARLDIVPGGDGANIAAGDLITFTVNGVDVDMYMPAVTTTEGVTYYVDSNGLLYSDQARTTPVIDTAINNETMSTSEDEYNPQGGTVQKAVTSEDATSTGDVAIVDAVVTDDIDSGEVPEIHHENKVLVLSSNDIVVPVLVTEGISVLDVGELAQLVSRSESVTLTQMINVQNLAYVQRIVSVVSLSEDIDENALVDVLLQGVDVGSAWYVNEDGIGAISNEDKTLVRIGPVDFGVRGLKVLDSVHVGANSYDGLLVRVFFKYTNEDEWRSTMWLRVGANGMTMVGVAGDEFKVEVLSSLNKVAITYVRLGVKNIDKRFVRSGYVINS